MNIQVRIEKTDIDSSILHTELRGLYPSCGAYLCFTGVARADSHDKGKTDSLFLEAYEAMALTQITKIAKGLLAQHEIEGISVVHRIGHVAVDEEIVFVGVASRHRSPAFLACEKLMDYLKNDVPIWKKEQISNEYIWVEQKASDISAKNRWE